MKSQSQQLIKQIILYGDGSGNLYFNIKIVTFMVATI
jgi:hypothetical protein